MIVMPPLGALVAVMAMEQRRIDQTPCSTCGGDRLRADFVTPGVCHVGGTAAT